MNWYQTFDAVFFVTVATLFVGLLKVAFDKCVESKCENFSMCWDFIRVKRRVDLEMEEHIRTLEIKRQMQPSAEETAISTPKSQTITVE
jgi:hypothetical protein